jgi:hypothetical protein
LKLSVLIPSRGRAFRLKTMLDTIRGLESGKHEISYVIGCDSDDPETVTMGYLLKLYDCRIAPRCMVRQPSLGVMMNRLIDENPADAYVCLCDDVMVLTPHWDDAISDAWTVRPDGVWWWRTLAVRPATYAIVSEKWRKASGQIWTDYFPFWWDDMWLLQVWMFASGLPILPVEAWLDDQAQSTTRMRDLRFWSDFYTWSKGKRQAQAVRIAKALGWPPAPLDDNNRCDVSAAFYREADKIEANQGDKFPPTVEYLKAKERAEQMMGLL